MTDVSCETGVELLMDYLEGVVPDDMGTILESHLAGCPKCAAFIASYLATAHPASRNEPRRGPRTWTRGGTGPRTASAPFRLRDAALTAARLRCRALASSQEGADAATTCSSVARP